LGNLGNQHERRTQAGNSKEDFRELRPSTASGTEPTLLVILTKPYQLPKIPLRLDRAFIFALFIAVLDYV
jgi:hypothetical protein